MKKHLFLILRLAVAAAGIGYIVWSLTWVDHVLVPAGTAVHDRPLEADRAFPIVDGDAAAFNAGLPVVVRTPGGPAPADVWSVPVDGRGNGNGQCRFQPGIRTTLGGARPSLLLLGFLVLGPIFPIQALRWFLLLRARGLHVSFGRTFRLAMVGNFFNYCMPGSTGGDVVKAFYAARGSGRKADTVMSIIFDRATGMIGLLLVGGLAGLAMLGNPAARAVAGTIWLLGLAVVAGGVVYFTPGIRRRLGLDWLLARLPGRSLLSSIDAAATAYRDHKGAVLAAIGLAMLVHTALVSGTTLAGYALGIGHPTGLMAAVIPLLLLGMTIPISYQGLGIMEGLGMPLLVAAPACTANQLIGMLLLLRLYMVTYSMLGALCLLGSDIRLQPRD